MLAKCVTAALAQLANPTLAMDQLVGDAGCVAPPWSFTPVHSTGQALWVHLKNGALFWSMMLHCQHTQMVNHGLSSCAG